MKKEGWKYVEFKEVFPIKMGKTPPRGEQKYWDVEKKTRNKWVSIADISLNEGKILYDTKEYISDEAAAKINIAKKGSLLLSFKLSIGKMAFAGSDMFTNEAIISIPVTNNYLLKFIYYYFLIYDWKSLFEGKEKVKGATLNKGLIGKIQIPIISLKDQQQIVEYLDSTFEKINKIKEDAEKKIAEAKLLFQATLNEKLKIREGWKEMMLKEICEIKGGKRVPRGYKLENIPTSHKYIRVSDFNDKGSVNLEDIHYINEEIYQQIKRYTITSEDVYISIAGTIGKSGIIPQELNGSNLTENACKLVIEKKLVYKYFVYYFTISDYFKNQINKLTKIAAQPKLAITRLATLNIPIPSLAEQQQIVTELDSLSEKTKAIEDRCRQIIEECDKLKQAILKQVFE